jgi:hypothetical protein
MLFICMLPNHVSAYGEKATFTTAEPHLLLGLLARELSH